MKTLNIAIFGAFVLGQAASAGTITYIADLLGTSENPSNASPGTGFATVIIDTVAQTMDVDVIFSGLLGPDTASLIHCCTASPGIGNAGVATPTFAGFPLGVTSGSYNNDSNLLDLTLGSSYNSAFVAAQGGTVAGAEAALLAGLAAGDAYLNIHTTLFPGGEIEGFLVVTPEPATLLMAGATLAGLAILRRKRAA
jgi:CHRD domain/PEP-CTERM motif